MNVSEVLAEITMPPQDKWVSTQLYCMLGLLLEGSAQRLLDHAGGGEGLLSWRTLAAEHETALLLDRGEDST